MRTLFRLIFLANWQRKLTSTVLALVLWLVVNYSQTSSVIVDNVAIRVINIPSGMTVEGLQPSGLLSQKLSLHLLGRKNSLEDITSNDLEVVVDATDKFGEWLVTISKKNLVALNPDLDIGRAITRVNPIRMPVALTHMVTEKIPVIINYPTGAPPPDYHFLDIWPYHLNLTVGGPESVIQQLKAEGLSLTFNLNHIAREDLEAASSSQEDKDEITFFVPEEWKKILIPALSTTTPFTIDDPLAKDLRIDFVRSELCSLGKALPLQLFYPSEYTTTLNPEIYTIAQNELVHSFHGLHFIKKSLYTKGVSKLFVEIIQDKIQLAVIMAPKNERVFLDCSVQLLNSRLLEDRYVSVLLSDSSEEKIDYTTLQKKEEYLRNRFRKYMQRLELYDAEGKKVDLKIQLQGNIVQVEGEPCTG